MPRLARALQWLCKAQTQDFRIPIECKFAVAKALIFVCACLHNFNFIRREYSSDLAEDMEYDSGNGEDEAVVAVEEVLQFDSRQRRSG